MSDRTWLAEVDAHLREDPHEYIEEISPLDRMFTHNETVPYFPAGRLALKHVRLAMLAAGRDDLRSILDFGAAFGRVLRMLKAAFPDARLTAADVRRDAVDFCADVLGATPVYSSHEPSEIELEGPFDLIWCGSVFTHFSPRHWQSFLPWFESLLSPGGLLVFSTLGRAGAERFASPQGQAGLAAGAAMVRDYERDGFGYSPYVRQPDQGVALTRPAWVLDEVARRTELRVVSLSEAAWGKQDVVGCARGPFAPNLPAAEGG